eukprot:1454396-Rhodomonas_salina.1
MPANTTHARKKAAREERARESEGACAALGLGILWREEAEGGGVEALGLGILWRGAAEGGGVEAEQVRERQHPRCASR